MNSLTPKQLYAKFLTGHTPEYMHRISKDKPLQQLNKLVRQYQENPSIKGKKLLLEAEQKMVFKELKHPELTLARNYDEIACEEINENASPAKIRNRLVAYNLWAIVHFARMLQKDFKSEISPKQIKFIKETANSLDDSAVSRSCKNIVNLSFKSKISQTQIKTYLKDLKKDINQPDKFSKVLQNANRKNSKTITRLVNSILLNPNQTSQETHRLAIWGAGKYRSDEGFKVIKNIALNTKETDVRKREFAIQSTALYLREKPDEVKEIMSKIQQDGSIHSPLARILNDKINGRYLGQKNRELNYNELTDKEKKQFLKQKNKFLQSSFKLNIQQQNKCDNSLLPFRNYFSLLSANKAHYKMIDDTITAKNLNWVGRRSINYLDNAGPFIDSFEGATCGRNCIQNKAQLQKRHNVMAHETTHLFHSSVEIPKIDKLYNKANKNNNILDDYSKANKLEYFAQGVEAMVSPYKPHSQLLKRETQNNTRYKLLDKDPELFKFIKNLFDIKLF